MYPFFITIITFKHDCFDIATDRPSTKKNACEISYAFISVGVGVGEKRCSSSVGQSILVTGETGAASSALGAYTVVYAWDLVSRYPVACLGRQCDMVDTVLVVGSNRAGRMNKRFSIRHQLSPSNRNGTDGHVRQSHSLLCVTLLFVFAGTCIVALYSAVFLSRVPNTR